MTSTWFHFSDDHLSQSQAVADFCVHDGRVLDFISIQSNCGNDSSRNQFRIVSPRRLPRSFEAFW